VKFAARVARADVETSSAYFRAHGVDPVLAADDSSPSGVLVTILDASGERSFLTDRGANLNLTTEDLSSSLLDGVGLLMVSGYSFFTDGPRAAVMTLLKQAKARGIATAIDPASVGFLREVGAQNFLKWTGGSDMIFANIDEGLALTGSVDLNLQTQTLGRSFGQVIIKRGDLGGAVGGRQGVTLSLPAPRVEVIDTTGAGDAFAAGYLIALMRGDGPEDCLKAGIAAGTRAVGQIGGQPV
jgi:sugar/nucleoside kinase (ribokinase family)